MAEQNGGGSRPGATPEALDAIATEVVACRACPRLVAWREAAPHQARHQGDPAAYWARALPGFGDPQAGLVLVGLAPAAHGGNRTGRMFTGDRSGDFLFAALHRAGFASQAASYAADDGLRLTDAYVTAAVRCAPPDNRPTNEERRTCAHFLRAELEALVRARVIVALGAFAFEALYRDGHLELERGARFEHGRRLLAIGPHGPVAVHCSYHPSQRNVFTGLLSAAMLDEVLLAARRDLEQDGRSAHR